MSFIYQGLVYVHTRYSKWDKRSKIFRIIIGLYSKMTLYFKLTSYLCKVSHMFATNSQSETTFISVITNKDKTPPLVRLA